MSSTETQSRPNERLKVALDAYDQKHLDKLLRWGPLGTAHKELNDPSKFVVEKAADLLAKSDDPKAARLLEEDLRAKATAIEALPVNKREPSVLRAGPVADALAKNVNGFDAAAQILNSPEFPSLQLTLVSSIGDSKHPKASQVLQEFGSNDANKEWARSSAWRYVDELGSDGMMPMATFLKAETSLSDAARTVIARFETHARLDNTAYAVLIDTARTHDAQDVRSGALFSAATARPVETRALILERLAAEIEPAGKAGAITALGRQELTSDIPLFVEMLHTPRTSENPSLDIQEAALKAIGRNADPRAASIVREASMDPSLTVSVQRLAAETYVFPPRQASGPQAVIKQAAGM